MNKDVHIRLSLHLNYFEKESEKCVIVVASSSERFDERATLLSVYSLIGEGRVKLKVKPQARNREQLNRKTSKTARLKTFQRKVVPEISDFKRWLIQSTPTSPALPTTSQGPIV